MADYRIIKVKGKTISREGLKTVWEAIRQELIRNNYRVEDIKMPEINARLVKRKQFDSILNKLKDTLKSDNERGAYESAKQFRATYYYNELEHNYIVVISEDTNIGLDGSGTYALLCIWEDILKREYGAFADYLIPIVKKLVGSVGLEPTTPILSG